MKRTTEYQANDGTRFATADECKMHERESIFRRVANLTHDQVKDALARTDLQLADAIEYAGNLIAQKRRADGGAKRKRKTIAEKHAEVPTTITAMQAPKDRVTPIPKKVNK